ncbi:MAG: ABC transporter substrate-binding protein [Desulfohalobiaceae bacterium]
MRSMTGIRLALIVPLLLLASGCGSGEKKTKALKPVTLAAYAGDTCLLAYLAEDKGFFEEAGVEVTLRDFQAGKLAVDDMLAGKSDLALGADFVFVNQSFSHPELRIMAAVCESMVNHLVVRKDHDITEPGDLAGKRIGVTRGSAGEFYLGTFLLFQGFRMSQVTMVDLKPNEIVDQLLSGSIDAGLTWEPNVYKLEQALGGAVQSWPAQSGQPMYFLLQGQAEWVQGHEAEIRAVLAAMRQAEAFVAGHQDQAQGFLVDRFGLDTGYVEATWGKQDFLLALPQELLVQMGDQAAWMVDTEQKAGASIPNFYEKVVFPPLEQVDPGAVTIIR